MSSYVYGVGTSFFGKQPNLSEQDLAWQAVLEALDDAGVDRVDAAYVGTAFGTVGAAQRCLSTLGVVDVPVVSIENACASASTALHEARHAVESGRYGTVLVLGVEQMTRRVRGAISPELDDPEGRAGLTMPSHYALMAQRYIAVHGATPSQLAAVSVKNFSNALHNPRAESKGSYTVEEVLSSRMISDPLTRLQCCGISDGAAAAVIGPVRRGGRDVRIRATALRSGKLWDHRTDHVWGFELIRDTTREAFEAAQVGIDDIDLAEVHDAFSISEVVATEALGLAAEGEGAAVIASGLTGRGGKLPINTSGGLLARGHPIAATGLAQVHEVVLQLRREAGSRQVGRATLGLVETLGGGTSGIDGNGCVVTVLEAA